jgi:hypothetical protein
MYSLTVVFGTPATSWRFLFRSKEKAEQAIGLISDHPTQDLHIADDFGQSADIKALTIHGRMLENLDESQNAYVEMALHNARVQAKAQERAKADPAIRAAQRGPAVLAPIGNGMS